jgi:hypothetical protein
MSNSFGSNDVHAGLGGEMWYNTGMPSRTKRKRHRRQLAKATANSPKTAGGWGQGSVTRGDCRLLRHAIREGWDAPEQVRDLIVDDMMAIFTDDEAKPRLQIAATLAIIEMARDNQEHLVRWGR